MPPGRSPETDAERGTQPVEPLEEAPVLEMLLREIEGDDPRMRAAAVETAASVPGEHVTLWWVARLRRARGAARAAILDLLGRRGDVAALPPALESMKDADESVRIAAIRTAAALGKEMVVLPLAAALASPHARERSAARKALLEVPGEAACEAIAMSLDAVTAQARSELLEILAARGARAQADVVLVAARDKDGAVRVAALAALSALADAEALAPVLEFLVRAEGSRERRAAEKAVLSICGRTRDKERCAEPVLAALPGSGAKARCSLLKILAQLGTRGALDAVRKALEDKEASVCDAAVRALGSWPNAAAAPVLLKLAQSAPKKTHQILAVRGYLRAAGFAADRSLEDALDMYKTAAGLAGRTEEKRLVLSGLAQIAHVRALAMAEAFLEDGSVGREAAAAVVRIARAVGKVAPGEARRSLEKVLGVSQGERVREEARQVLSSIKKN